MHTNNNNYNYNYSVIFVSVEVNTLEDPPNDFGVSTGNGKYTALFDASGYDSLYPVEQESNLIKSGTTIGHIKYKMFNSDGETPKHKS